MNRTISKVTKSPLHKGFLGPGHLAAAVVDGTDYIQTDPFILLMDDHLDLPGGPPVGGPHPHAGFETVTLVLEGNGKEWLTGSLELMTAGKGIVHTEEITTRTRMRILQLWLALPPEKRWTEPGLQRILLEDVPLVATPGAEIRVYSGSSNGFTSPLRNHSPFLLVDFKVKGETRVVQEIPAAYNGFIYVLEGAVWIDDTKVTKGQAAWLNKVNAIGNTTLVVNSRSEEARIVLYAGQPHGAPIVSHGPFVANTEEEIKRLYSEYREGKIPHLNDIPPTQKVQHYRVEKSSVHL